MVLPIGPQSYIYFVKPQKIFCVFSFCCYDTLLYNRKKECLNLISDTPIYQSLRIVSLLFNTR